MRSTIPFIVGVITFNFTYGLLGYYFQAIKEGLVLASISLIMLIVLIVGLYLTEEEDD